MAHPRVYPLALLLEGRPCLVVGGMHVARQKVAGLLAAGARVTVVAPEVLHELEALPVLVHRRRFEVGDSAGCVLVVAATGDRQLDALVAADARAHGALVNAADNPASCDFYLPATLVRGDVTIAVSTAGASPALASWVRNRVAAALPEELDRTCELVAEVRAEVKAAGRSSEELDWQGLIEALVAAFAKGSEEEARLRASEWLIAQGVLRAGRPGSRRPGERAGDG